MIEHSAAESALFGLKFGRCRMMAESPGALIGDIFKNKYDVVRLTVAADDVGAQARLHEIGVPAFLSGIVSRYEWSRARHAAAVPSRGQLRLERCGPREIPAIEEAIKSCFEHDALGFYPVPYFEDLVPPPVQLEALSSYLIKKLETGADGHHCFKIMDGTHAVGFTVNKLASEGKSEVVISGILSQHRKKGFYREFVQVCQNWFFEQGVDSFTTGARIQNGIVRKTLVLEGMVPIANEMIYCLTPFFNYAPERGRAPQGLDSEEPHRTWRQSVSGKSFGFAQNSKALVSKRLNRILKLTAFLDPYQGITAAVWAEFRRDAQD